PLPASRATVASATNHTPRRRSRQQAFEQAQVEAGEHFEIGDAHVLVDLVDAGIDRSDLDALRAQGRYEARVGRPATGALLRRQAGMRTQHITRRFPQSALRREEWFTAAVPAQRKVQPVARKHGLDL